MDSCLSQGNKHKVKHTQPHPGLELRSLISFPMKITIALKVLHIVTWYAIKREWKGGQYPYPSLFESKGIKKKTVKVVGERKGKLSAPYTL